MKNFDDNIVNTSPHSEDNLVVSSNNDSENTDEDPLESIGNSVEEPEYYKLVEVVFAEPLEDAVCAKESDPLEDAGEITFVDNVMIKKRAGKRNKYFIDVKDGCSECPLSTCTQTFATTALLKAHVRKVHCAPTKYVCEQCGASFKAPYLLRRHLAVHSGQRVQCGVCGKWLSARTDLSVHLRTHTATRPHACQLCHKSFLRLSSLNTHVKFVHRDGDIPCGVCDARFDSRTLWNRHRSTHAAKK